MGQTLKPIDSPAAWTAAQMRAQPERWIYRLNDTEANELGEAAIALDKTGIALEDLTPADVSLPILGPALKRMRHDCLFGHGFYLIRGVPLDGLTFRQKAMAFWICGFYMGDEVVSQNAMGQILGHVYDLGFDYGKHNARAYQSNAGLLHHNDGGDLVALLSIRTPKSGGLSTIASSVSVYNYMVERRPDLAEVLTRPLYRDYRDEQPEGRGPWYKLPAFNFRDGKVFVSYIRSTVNKAQRFDEVPRISDEQAEAMDMFDSLASGDELRLDMEFEPGDIQYLCNHFILHARTEFEDWPEPERKRHLLRMWLSCNDGPALPEALFNYQIKTAGGRVGGIIQPQGRRHAPLSPVDGGGGDSTTKMRDRVPAE